MPYIRIKAYPKDQATKEKVVEAISIEEVAPEDWVETVEKAEIEPHYRTGQRLWQADDASCH
ncbi:MAG: hypothetical protein ILA25_03995 [Prevotella sp.]|nr:hypothetical protein [Prevotella sp.]